MPQMRSVPIQSYKSLFQRKSSPVKKTDIDIVTDEYLTTVEQDLTLVTDEEKNKCKLIIHTSAVAAGAATAGLAQVPVFADVAIVPVQIAMTIL
ncbi:MAG: hypothetical protein HQM11_21265, partial [SAR324 cluster bacterium]|nr:hypothetical protein [SAR324 cluster bacterium]